MDSRGDIPGIVVIMIVAMGLVLLALGIAAAFGGFGQLKTAMMCTGQGGQCVADSTGCGNGAYWSPSGWCGTGQHCCKNTDGSRIAQGTTPGTTPGTTALPMPSLSGPTTSSAYASKGKIAESQTIQTFYGASVQSSQFPLKVTTQINLAQKSVYDANNKPASSAAATTGSTLSDDYKWNAARWVTLFVLQTSSNQQIALVSCQYTGDTGGTVNVNCSTDNSPQAGGFAVQPTAPAIQNSPVPAVTPPNPAVILNKDGSAFVTTTYYVTPAVLSQYVGQTLHLLVYTYPDTPSAFPNMERQYNLYFKVSSHVTYTGVSTTWTNKESISAKCQGITCDGIYYSLVDSPDQCANTASFTDAVVAGAPQLAQQVTQYCVLGGPINGQCSDTQADCTASFRAPKADAFFNSAILPLYNAASGNTLSTTQLQTYLPAFATATSSSYTNGICVPKKMIVKDVTALSLPSTGLFRADAFDPLSQTASFTLDYAFMSKKYLCVYGREASTKTVYSAGPGQQLLLDTTPPNATIDFNPLTLDIKFSCADDTGGSGCKDSFGVAYISDVTKFLPALVSGPQNAATWCPQYKTAAGYSTETRHEVFYNSPEVRVLCVRWEDKAGNPSVTMATLYNGYDTLAAAIVMSKQK